jgi:hypothetical protein
MSLSLALPISTAAGRGFIDSLEGSPLPVLRIFGWFSAQTLPLFEVRTGSGKNLAPLSSARVLREDVGELGGESAPFSGFRVDFLIEADDQPQQLLIDGEVVFTFPAQYEKFGAISLTTTICLRPTASWVASQSTARVHRSMCHRNSNALPRWPKVGCWILVVAMAIWWNIFLLKGVRLRG